MIDRWKRRELLFALAGAPALLGLGGCGPAESRRRVEGGAERFSRLPSGAERVSEWPTSLKELRPQHLEIRNRTRRRSDGKPDVILGLLEQMAGEECWSFPVSLKLHSLQAATRAYLDDPKDEEAVVAALCHDAATILASPHDRVAGMILEGHVREELVQVVSHHTVFQRRFRKASPTPWIERRDTPFEAYLEHQGEPWFELALTFTERWDQPSFDPDYETLPLRHFEPMVRRLFG